MGPVAEQAADALQDTARMVHVDTDQEPELAARYRVVGIPTSIRFGHGQETGRLIGFRPVEELLSFARGEARRR
ncbi:MAG: thioredoxin family protein [Clostridia bacterium]